MRFSLPSIQRTQMKFLRSKIAEEKMYTYSFLHQQ